MEATATLSMVDGHIRFEPGYRLDDEEYQAVKSAGLHWKRIDEAFVGPWTPACEDFLQEQFGVELEMAEVDLVEQAERRAEAYEGFSGNAGARADAAFEQAHDIAGAIPLGQPILIGHHSEKRHRRDLERIDSKMRKAVEQSGRRDYWKSRAEATLAKAKRREKPGAIQRRIERLEADQRKWSEIAESGLHVDDVRWLGAEGKSDEEIREILEQRKVKAERWLAFLEMRLEYERALLESVGGLPADEMTFEKGGAIYSEPWGWEEIIAVNKKSVSVKRVAGLQGDNWWRETRKYDRIRKTLTNAEWDDAQAQAAEAKAKA